MKLLLLDWPKTPSEQDKDCKKRSCLANLFDPFWFTIAGQGNAQGNTSMKRPKWQSLPLLALIISTSAVPLLTNLHVILRR